MRTLAYRLWTKVDKSGDCWVWTGATVKGYGCIWTGQRIEAAHRVVWEMTYGPIPDGLWVLHRCDNRPCVRPEHLFLGTRIDNIADASAKGRLARCTLSAAQIAEVHQRYVNGQSRCSLALTFGVTRHTINRILFRPFPQERALVAGGQP